MHMCLVNIGTNNHPTIILHYIFFFNTFIFSKSLNIQKSLKFDSHSVVGRFDSFFKNYFTTLLH